MAIGCGAKCAKSILVTFNLFFWVSGCTLLGMGMLIILEPGKTYLFHLVSDERMSSREMMLYLAYTLVAIGSVILLVGFLGCCGALQESKCLLATYLLFLLLILLAELSVAVATLMFREHKISGLETRLTHRLKTNYGNKDEAAFSNAMDFVQFKFNCCGISSDEDYLASNWWNETNAANKEKNVPTTCCLLADTNNVSSHAGSPISVVSRVFYGYAEEAWQNPQPKQEESCQSTEPRVYEQARHTQGCFQEIQTWFKQETAILIVAGTATGALQLLGMILSVCFCRALNEEE